MDHYFLEGLLVEKSIDGFHYHSVRTENARGKSTSKARSRSPGGHRNRFVQNQLAVEEYRDLLGPQDLKKQRAKKRGRDATPESVLNSSESAQGQSADRKRSDDLSRNQTLELPARTSIYEAQEITFSAPAATEATPINHQTFQTPESPTKHKFSSLVKKALARELTKRRNLSPSITNHLDRIATRSLASLDDSSITHALSSQEIQKEQSPTITPNPADDEIRARIQTLNSLIKRYSEEKEKYHQVLQIVQLMETNYEQREPQQPENITNDGDAVGHQIPLLRNTLDTISRISLKVDLLNRDLSRISSFQQTVSQHLDKAHRLVHETGLGSLSTPSDTKTLFKNVLSTK